VNSKWKGRRFFTLADSGVSIAPYKAFQPENLLTISKKRSWLIDPRNLAKDGGGEIAINRPSIMTGETPFAHWVFINAVWNKPPESTNFASIYAIYDEKQAFDSKTCGLKACSAG